ncbi:MAG: flavodoxin domain-containing protein [Candidatus Merdivicinus sp.]
MGKIAVIYWSGTGNTQAMAEAVAKGAGSESILLPVSEISANEAANYEKLALGCPAMGVEVLEEAEFEPFFSELEGSIQGKKIALFGSYGWGDGEWMRNWQERVIAAGGILCGEEGLILNEMPDADGLEACAALGSKLAAME